MDNNKEKKSIVAKIMEKAARKSAEAAVDSMCMYIYHQPKMPEGMDKIKK